MKVARTIAFVCLFLGAGALQAHAFDMTGTWEGQWSCRVQINGTPTTIANDNSVMKVTQIGSVVHVDIDNGAYLYNGWAAADNDNAKRGASTFVDCETSPRSRLSNEVISARVKAPSGSSNGEFNGTSAYNSTDEVETDLGGICQYTYTRTSSTDPGIEQCPPRG
jgi:hypothetical protein